MFDDFVIDFNSLPEEVQKELISRYKDMSERPREYTGGIDIRDLECNNAHSDGYLWAFEELFGDKFIKMCENENNG